MAPRRSSVSELELTSGSRDWFPTRRAGECAQGPVAKAKRIIAERFCNYAIFISLLFVVMMELSWL